MFANGMPGVPELCSWPESGWSQERTSQQAEMPVPVQVGVAMGGGTNDKPAMIPIIMGSNVPGRQDLPKESWHTFSKTMPIAITHNTNRKAAILSDEYNQLA